MRVPRSLPVTSSPRLVAGLVALCLLAAACGPPVTVRRVDPRDIYSRDSASVLDSGEPTRFTTTEVHLSAVTPNASNREKLAVLYREAIEQDRPEFMLPLAELSFLEGDRTGDPSSYLGAAVYAYLYLFSGEDPAASSPWDPRTRIAADIYNRALSRAFASGDGEDFVFADGIRRLPLGQITIEAPEKEIEWKSGVRFEEFLAADVFEVDGLAARYRSPGLGAPLIARRTRYPGDSDLFPPRLEIPATAFLRVEATPERLRTGTLRGSLELYDPRRTPQLEVRGFDVPLEAQTSSAYAHALGRSPFWEFEIAGFLSGGDDRIPTGISLLQPYEPDRIPVVFIHGTASSPGRWAGLFNDLINDPAIKDRFQFWFFSYNSGNPISYSAMRLREAIDETADQLDPEGDDYAMQNLILVGHSQGGLLTRMSISDSTELDYEAFGIRKPEEADLPAEDRKALLELLRFQPMPQVRRVVFIATQHRGSYVAGGFLGRMGASLIDVSRRVLDVPVRALQVPIEIATTGTVPIPTPEDRIATAVDNMAPNSLFNMILATIPMSPEVPRHSIIAVAGNGPVESGNDGVVAYKSAHIESATSEIVVRSGHSVQSNPETVAEVRRILLEHLSEAPADSGRD